MQVRVFEATDMASGLKKIKEELGPDALILSTRTVRHGKLGILGKPTLEITAAVDTDFPRPANNLKGYSQAEKAVPQPAARQSTGFRQIVDDSVESYLNDQPATHLPEKKKAPAAFDAPPTGENESGLHNEVNELKDLVKNLAGQISQLTEKTEQTRVDSQSGLKIKDTEFAARYTSSPIHGDHILSLLIERGINVETARTITGFLRQSLTEQELCNPDNVSAAIRDTIENLIEVNPPIFKPGEQQQRIALVGPTGVGKTTTLAKIAASHLSKYSGKIALITIDTYRIAAVEQLKVYGEIMRLPVDVVITPEQLAQAIAKHGDKDLILIDTAGRSPRDSFCIEELGSFLTPDLKIDKHLVLSAGTRENELLDTIERFNTLGIGNTIFTKVDECSSLGILLNIQIQNPNPLSYVTNGQRVPEDLIEISPKIVAELIMSQNQGSVHD